MACVAADQFSDTEGFITITGGTNYQTPCTALPYLPSEATLRALCPAGTVACAAGPDYVTCPFGQGRYGVTCYSTTTDAVDCEAYYDRTVFPGDYNCAECSFFTGFSTGAVIAGMYSSVTMSCTYAYERCKYCSGFFYSALYGDYCCPACSAGLCWCDDSETCVTCDPDGEDCAAELNAEWNPFTCEVDIDEPDCGEGTGLEWDWESCACAAPGGGIGDSDIQEAGDYAVSIVELSDGTFVRVWRVPSGDPLGDPVYSATSRDRGASWTTAVQINALYPAGPGSWPQLLVTRGDVVLAFFHEKTFSGRSFRSTDQGASWTLNAAFPSTWRFPTAILDSMDRIVIATYNSTRKMTEIYESFDYFGDSFTAIPIASGLAFGKAPASILLGRSGEIAVFFTGGSAAAYMKYSLDGGHTWSHGTQVDTGRFPVAAMGVGHGLMSTANAGRATESTSFLRNDGAATIATRITQINSSTVWLFRGMLFSERDGRFYRTFRDPTLGPTTQYFEDPNFTSPSWEYCV